MKKISLIPLLLFSFCAFAQVKNAIPSKPAAAAGFVHDYTKKLITAEQEDHLEQKLRAYDDSTSNQIAIVIVDDLKGYDANQFATAIGDEWGVGGSKQFDNGIVILISTDEKNGGKDRDAYIATGRGMEGPIPDMTAAYIVDHELIPNFKEGKYYRGLDEAVDAIIKAAAGEFKAPQGYGKGLIKDKTIGRLIFIIVMIIVFIIISNNRNKGGGYASRRGYRDWWGPTIWGSGGGFGGGSSGGGGWGGFGGGSFGGGGAGGKW